MWYTFLHEESVNVLQACQDLSGVCWDLSGFVETCQEFVGTCQDLLRLVRTCWDLSGLVRNVDFMESHFEGIAIVVDKIFAKFPIPKILWSVPEFLKKPLSVKL